MDGMFDAFEIDQLGSLLLPSMEHDNNIPRVATGHPRTILLPSFLPSYLPSVLPSVLTYSLLTCFLPSLLPFLFTDALTYLRPCFPPSLLHSYLPH